MTLLETALLLSVIGVALAAFMPAFLGELRFSKVQEAGDQLDALHRATAAYWNSHPRLASGERGIHCLPEAAGPAPAEPSPGGASFDFAAEETPGHETWRSLGFAPARALRYRYSLLTNSAGCEPRDEDTDVQVWLRAEGDLDDDGVLSTFELELGPDESGALAPRGSLRVTRRTE